MAVAEKVSMFEKLMFSNSANSRAGRLTSREVDYWKVMFNKILKVGEEFEVHIPDNANHNEIFTRFNRDFTPTGTVEYVGDTGVLEVKTDGSVPNGMELVTVGRRFNWKTFYEMNKQIIDKFQENDFYTTHHTGIHIHMLAGYSNSGTSELERNVPEIILANYYQLHRIFAPELFWIASGGTNNYAITRYILFRQPPFDYTPLNHSMDQIREGMNSKYGKYQMINLNPSSIGRDGINRFHVELRYPDTHLSPAYATALVALEVAMLNKAIDISQCGVISMKQDEYDFRRKLFDKFANLGTGDRDSDSSELTDLNLKQLQTMTKEMIKWFKSEISAQSPVAYEILKKIAVEPASQLRIGGKSWRMIEDYIYPPELVDSENADKLIQIISLQQVTDCGSANAWKNKVSGRLSVPMDKVNELLEYLGKEKIVVFDKEIGAMMFKQIV
jgi:hypothetical protein